MSEFTSWINVWIFTEICIHLRCGTLLYFNCIPSFNKQIFGIWGNVCTQLENVQVVGSSRGCYLPTLLMKGTARKRTCSLSRKLDKLMSGLHPSNHDVRVQKHANCLIGNQSIVVQKVLKRRMLVLYCCSSLAYPWIFFLSRQELMTRASA